jgi:hypothetical protein
MLGMMSVPLSRHAVFARFRGGVEVVDDGNRVGRRCGDRRRCRHKLSLYRQYFALAAAGRESTEFLVA